MNRVFLIGNITKKPELISSASGKPYTRICVAVRRDKDKTDFIDVKAFGQTCETMVRFLDKGSKVAIEGTISTGSFEKEGKTIKSTDIIVNSFEFLDSKGTNTTNTAKVEKTSENPSKTLDENAETLDSSSDLPF